VAALSPGKALPALSFTDARGGAAAPPSGETLYGFFKTTCPTCELAWPFFDRIGRAARGGKLTVVAVSQDEPGEADRFNRRLGVELTTLFDPAPCAASEALGLDTVPTFVRVGADGTVRGVVLGFQKQKMEELGAEAAALAGKPAPAIFRPGEVVPLIKPG
jgi:thiol-disulfide isomerase/thioredoxin